MEAKESAMQFIKAHSNPFIFLEPAKKPFDNMSLRVKLSVIKIFWHQIGTNLNIDTSNTKSHIKTDK